MPTNHHRPQFAANSPRLGFLDSLRGIAALAVVVAHAATILWPSFNTFRFKLFDAGTWGVTVFFLCSGFVIPISLQQGGSLQRFWIKRIWRLYPLYWVSAALAVLVYMLLGRDVSGRGVPAEPITTLLANLSMFQAILGYHALLTVNWTLSFEMVFYILISVVFGLGLTRRIGALTVGLILTATLLEGVLPLVSSVQLPLGYLSCLATMFVGTVWYRVYARQIKRTQGLAVGGIALIMVVVTTLGAGLSQGDITRNVYVLTGQIAGFAVWGAAYALRQRAAPAPLLFLGRISYSLYLLHGFVLLLVPQARNPFVTLLVWIGVALVVSTASYYGIERPALEMGQRMARRVRVQAGRVRVAPAR